MIPSAFFEQESVNVARQLLGMELVHEIDGILLSGRIIETEAYGHSNDPASHAYHKKTPRNQAMFGIRGSAYIYFIYGSSYCFNIVAYDSSAPAGAILIRALEPLEGMSEMQKRRNKTHIKDLTSGPGKITQALGIGMELNGKVLCKKEKLYLREGKTFKENEILSSSRIGIKVGLHLPWRFVIKKRKNF